LHKEEQIHLTCIKRRLVLAVTGNTYSQ